MRTKIDKGTPQARWRDSTQSGLFVTMPLIRFSPEGGAQRVRSIASTARARRRLAALRVGERPVHRQKPLRRVAEDHRRLRAPAVRILVLEPSARDERAGLDQRVDDGLVGVAGLSLVGDDALALEARRFFGEGAVLVDRIGNARLDSALLKEPRVRRPELEVLAPVARARCERSPCRRLPSRGRRRAGERRTRSRAHEADGRRPSTASASPLTSPRNSNAVDLRGVEHALGQRLREDVGRADLGPVVGGRVRHPVAPISECGGRRRSRGCPESSRASWSR